MEQGVSTARLDPDSEERFVRLRQELGVSSFGLNQMILQSGQRGRIHRHARQEEVYLVLEGELTVALGPAPSDERSLVSGDLIRVAPELKRQLSNRGGSRTVFLAIGGHGEHEGRDGEAFTDWSQESGAPPQEVPLPEDLPVA